MATRSRSLLFLQYRSSFTRSPPPSSNIKTASIGVDGYASSEKTGLIAASRIDQEECRVVDMSALPPRWVDIVEEVEDQMELIKEKVNKLDALHKKLLLPGFDDRLEEENALELLTEDITSLFRNCQRLIKQIKEERLTTGPITPQQLTLSKNIQTSLATRLQAVTSDFRKSQSVYLQKLRQRSTRTGDLFPPSATSPSINPSSPFGDTLMSSTATTNTLQPFTNDQLTLLDSTSTAITTRETQIDQIAKSVFELAELFKDLQNLVIEQGTMLDRIDYNIEKVERQLVEGNEELDKGAKYQKQAGKTQLILLLILIILGLIIVLAVKKRR